MSKPIRLDLTTAVGQLLDTLARTGSVRLAAAEIAADTHELAAIVAALHMEACRRQMAVQIDARPGGELVVSLYATGD